MASTSHREARDQLFAAMAAAAALNDGGTHEAWFMAIREAVAQFNRQNGVNFDCDRMIAEWLESPNKAAGSRRSHRARY